MKVGGSTLCLNSPDKTEWYCGDKFAELSYHSDVG